jgi:glutamate synthase (NADPH) large chain
MKWANSDPAHPNPATVVSQWLLTAGDGAGLLVAMPEAFLIRVAAEIGIDLPPRNYYGVGMAFLPQDAELRTRVKATMDEV